MKINHCKPVMVMLKWQLKFIAMLTKKCIDSFNFVINIQHAGQMGKKYFTVLYEFSESLKAL